MPRPYRNRSDRLAPGLWLGLLFGFGLAACGPDCTSVCEKHQACMGPKAGNLDGCIAACTAQDFETKDHRLQCIEDSSCDQIAAGVCAPSCPEVCTRVQACGLPTYAQCTDVCSQLTYSQQECYIVNPCSAIPDTCASLATTEP